MLAILTYVSFAAGVALEVAFPLALLLLAVLVQIRRPLLVIELVPQLNLIVLVDHQIASRQPSVDQFGCCRVRHGLYLGEMAGFVLHSLMRMLVV